MALPSGKVDPSVFEDVADAEDWTTGNLSRRHLPPRFPLARSNFNRRVK